jgi:hypothetical protein
MWKPFICRLLRDHDYRLRREPTEIFLECERCGRRSPGWNLATQRVNRAASGLRLSIADPGGDPVRAVSAAKGIGSAMWARLSEAGEPRLRFSQKD